MTADAPRARTGPKPRFSREQAMRAALKIGVDRFTLAQVAGRLGVSAPSLYRVFSSREDLLDACLAHIVQDMRLSPDAAATWQGALRGLAEVLWQAMEEHPGLDRVILERPEAFVHLSGPLRVLIEHLLSRGFSGGREQLLRAVDFLADTVHATHLMVARMRGEDESGRNAAQRLAEGLQAEAAAHGTTALYEADGSWTDRGYLDRKIDFIIAGLEAGIRL